MTQQLQVGNVPVTTTRWYSCFKELVGDKIKTADPRLACPPAISGSVQSDTVFELIKIQEGNTIPRLKSLGPPKKVQPEAGVQRNRPDVVGTLQGVQHPRDEEPATSNDTRDIEKRPKQLLELLEGCLRLPQP